VGWIMVQLDKDNVDVYQLVNLIKEIPGSNINCKNTEGIVLWHNNNVIKDLKLNRSSMIGTTVFDIFSAESAELCVKDDFEVVNSRNIVCKQRSLQLITGEFQEYFITKTPWMDKSGQVGGIILHAVNMRKTLGEQLKSCYINNQENKFLAAQLQKLYFNFKQPLKEILLLANLVMSGEINNDSKSLCLELRNFAKTLLSDCDRILISNGNVQQVPLMFHKINLRTLVQEIFNKQIKIIKAQNTKLFLTVSNQIPEIIVGDLLRINKILQLIVNNLLKSALDFNNVDVKICCKIELFRKIHNESIIVSLIFEMEGYLLEKFINNELRFQNNIKLIPTLYDDSNFGLQLANKLVKELEGDIELITNNASPKIVIHFPVEIVC
jgi:hypothetical protein